MEAGRMGVPRMVSATAVKHSNKAATIINFSIFRFCGRRRAYYNKILSSQRKYVVQSEQFWFEFVRSQAHTRLISCNIRGSTFPPLIIATLNVVVGNSSS